MIDQANPFTMSPKDEEEEEEAEEDDVSCLALNPSGLVPGASSAESFGARAISNWGR